MKRPGLPTISLSSRTPQLAASAAFAAVTAPLLGGKSDHSQRTDRFNPLLIKEVRQGLRTKSFVIPFVLVQGFLTFAVGLELAEVMQDAEDGLGQGLFWGFLALFVAIAVPLKGLGSISQESKGGHVELFHLAGLSRWKVVVGKWTALFIQSALVLCATLPFLLLRYNMGGMELTWAVAGLLGLLGLSANITAMALAVSSFKSGLGRVLAMIYMPLSLLQNLGLALGIMAFWQAALQERGMELVVLPAWIFLGLIFTVCSVLMLLGIASAKLQLYESFYTGDRGNSLVILYIASPYVVLFVTLITFTFLPFLGWILLAWLAVRHQRMKDGDKDLLYTSRSLSRPIVKESTTGEAAATSSRQVAASPTPQPIPKLPERKSSKSSPDR